MEQPAVSIDCWSTERIIEPFLTVCCGAGLKVPQGKQAARFERLTPQHHTAFEVCCNKTMIRVSTKYNAVSARMERGG
jgi:hypothetical protein